jgi:hypothetical protein
MSRHLFHLRLDYKETTMAALAEFFEGSETTLGAFYPNHCLVAVFPDSQTAQQAVSKLNLAGFAADEAIAADGREILELEQTGLAGFLVQALSRFFSTEQKFTDHDLHHARHGAGFVAVRCRDENRKDKAWSIVRGEAPLDARFYGLGGIEHLAGDLETD